MLKLMDKKILTILYSKILCILTNALCEAMMSFINCISDIKVLPLPHLTGDQHLQDPELSMFFNLHAILAAMCDFQQCGILTSVDSYESVQPPFQLRNFK